METNILENHSDLNRIKSRMGLRIKVNGSYSVGIAQHQLTKKLNKYLVTKSEPFFKEIGLKPDKKIPKEEQLSFMRGQVVDKVMFRCNNLTNIGRANEIIDESGVDRFVIEVSKGVKKLFDTKKQNDGNSESDYSD